MAVDGTEVMDPHRTSWMRRTGGPASATALALAGGAVSVGLWWLAIVVFDIASYLWVELSAEARRLLHAVDALARAFDGLETQAVRLGECRIDVTGNKASARCAGSATWSPKVGSGTHTESRDWTFDLVRVGANWQILNARAQNR